MRLAHTCVSLVAHLVIPLVAQTLSRMYNKLVESCFDKCVFVGWGGVSSVV